MELQSEHSPVVRAFQVVVLLQGHLIGAIAKQQFNSPMQNFLRFCMWSFSLSDQNLLMSFTTTELLNQQLGRLLLGFFFLYFGLAAFRLKSSCFTRAGTE